PWRIGKSFVFIDFRRKNPEVAAAAGRGVGVKPRPQASERAHRHEPLRSGKGSFAARARRLAARPQESIAPGSPTPFERGWPRRRRGRIPETSGESIFQRIALARTFYARHPPRRATQDRRQTARRRP